MKLRKSLVAGKGLEKLLQLAILTLTLDLVHHRQKVAAISGPLDVDAR